MEKKQAYILLPKIAKEKFNCKTPILFAIPPSDYSDEMEKERDKGWYLKIQQLEKKSKLLREELQILTQNNFNRITATRQMIAQSVAVKEKFFQKRSAINDYYK
jgi:hypothetical protein